MNQGRKTKELLLQVPEDWRLKALEELNEDEGTSFDLEDDRGPDAGAELMEEVSYMVLREGNRDYYVFRDEGEAEAYALQAVTADLKNSRKSVV